MLEKIILLAVSICLFLLLFRHAVLCKGLKRGLSFFLFGIIWGLFKELRYSPAPYFFGGDSYSLFLSKIIAALGWVITFYLGLILAEKVVTMAKGKESTLWETLIMSGLVISAIAYFIEVAAISSGGWRWVIKSPSYWNTRFFVGELSIMVLGAWLYFGIHFLIAYFSVWFLRIPKAIKCLFMLLPFSAIETIRWAAPPLFIRIVLLYLCAGLLFRGKKNIEEKPHQYAFLRGKQLPLYIFAFLIAAAAIYDCFVGKDIFLLISVLPALTFLIAAIRFIPLKALFFLFIPCVFLFQEKAVPVVFSLLMVGVFQYEKILDMMHRNYLLWSKK